MSAVVEPPTRPPGDDLDGLLRAFLQQQMPQPWPPPSQMISVSVAPFRRGSTAGRPLMRSRWALAASVALLFLSSMLLPSRFAQNAKPDHGPNGPMISDIPPDMPKKHKNRMPIEKKNKPALAVDEDEQHPGIEESELLFVK